MPLIYLSCAWVAGIFLGSNLNLPLALSLTGLIPLPLLFLAHRHRRIVILTSLALFTLLAAAAYSHSSLYQINDNNLGFYNDQGTVEVKGIVATDPEVGDKGTRLNLSATEIKLDTGWRAVQGTALLSVPRYPTYSYGDVLRVTGKLETPSHFNDFDY